MRGQIEPGFDSRTIAHSAIGLIGLGVSFFAGYLLYINANESYLQGPRWIFSVGLLLIGVLAAGLVYGGYWIVDREFNSEQGWQVLMWCFAGLIGALALTFWPIFYQRIVGVRVEDPVFILLVSSGIGANAGVVAGISQVRSVRQFDRVEEARDSLQFLNRLLRHNVLNAVSVIQGNAELLIGRSDSEDVIRCAEAIQSRSQQITDLVKNTSVLIKRIDETPERERIDLASLVADQLEIIRTTHDEATIESDLPETAEIYADGLVSAIPKNLVENAIIHNDKEHPQVVVTLDVSDESVVLRVADDGPGLEQPRDEIVDPGKHGDRGIGLYLVDTLVSQYDGELRFSDNEPRGTVVEVVLPPA